ncbi:hypothetical protein AAD018_012150 [Aestuariibius insulae]
MKTTVASIALVASTTFALADDISALSTASDDTFALEVWSEHLPDDFTRK